MEFTETAGILDHRLITPTSDMAAGRSFFLETMPDRHAETPSDQGELLWGTINRLKQFFLLEKPILAILASYSVAIGLFSLIVPLTVQELVNTFALSIQPVMILTLSRHHGGLAHVHGDLPG